MREHGTRRSWAALTLAVAVMASTLLVGATAAAAAAQSGGRVCLFLRTNGAPVLFDRMGHVGWGYEIGPDSYRFGATENPSGARQVPPGGDIGWWRDSGSFDQMLRTMQATNYDHYSCRTTDVADATAADAKALAVRDGGYLGIGNNCLDHTYDILTAYGARFATSRKTHLRPRDWYHSEVRQPGWTPSARIITAGAMYLASHNEEAGGVVTPLGFGGPGDRPVVGDWDGDGSTEIGMLRGNQWWLADRDGFSRPPFGYGMPGDIPVAGDWNNDGIDTIGVYRPSEGRWYLRNSNTGGVADISFNYGLPTDVPVAGDWNNDGIDTPGVYRPTDEGLWVLSNTHGGNDRIRFRYGLSTDKPVVGDWDGDGTDTPAVLRGNSWVLSNTLGGADRIRFNYGIPGDLPVAGDWDFDGIHVDTVGVARGY